MAFPNSFDTFSGTTAQGTSTLTSPDHAQDHRVLGSALYAVEQKIGLGNGTPQANQILVGNASSGSALWGSVWNNAQLGTPTITRGTATNFTANNGTLGTPAITGGTYNTGVFGTPALQAGTATLGFFLKDNGTIAQVGTADHITLTPGTSKLVRVARFFDNGGTATYINQGVIIHGWARNNGDGVSQSQTGTVTTGITLGTAHNALMTIGPTSNTGLVAVTPTSTNNDLTLYPTYNTLTTTSVAYRIWNSAGGAIGTASTFVISYMIFGVI